MNKSYLVNKTYKNTYTKHNIQKAWKTPNQLVAIELNHYYTVKISESYA